MKRKQNDKKGIFKYISAIWTGDDGQPSVRRVLGIVFSIDLVVNFHQAGFIVTRVIKIIESGKALDAQVLAATSSFLANIGMIIGIEAGLVAAFFTLTTYQNIQLNKPTDSAISNVENVENVTVEQVQPVNETDKK